MEALQNLTLWLVLLSFACLLVIGGRWMKVHPRCGCCRKRIRRAFAYCPWCGMQQFHVRPVQRVQHRRTSRRSFVAQETQAMPHKRPRTVVLPDRPPKPAKREQRIGTVLVPEPYISSHVLICAQCKTVLHEDDRRCWYCNGTTFTWREKER